MLGQGRADPVCVLHCSEQQPRILHTGAVVGEDPDAESRHLCQRCKLGALSADGDRPCHRHIDCRGTAEVEHLGDHRSRVGRRHGVGHRQQRRVTAERACPTTGLDRLCFLAAGLAQVGVEVDQPRSDQAAAGVDLPGPSWRIDARRHLRDPTIHHEDVSALSRGSVHDRAASDQQ